MARQSAYQVCTIHGYVHDKGVPLLWALLPTKTPAPYKELFSGPEVLFKTCVAMKFVDDDDDTAVLNALQTAFEGIGKMRYLLCDFEWQP